MAQSNRKQRRKFAKMLGLEKTKKDARSSNNLSKWGEMVRRANQAGDKIHTAHIEKIYKDLKDFIILDKNQIISTLGYTKEEFKDGLYSQFIINTEIKYFLEKAINNKKNKDVIYIMDTLDRTFFLIYFNF